MNGRSSSLILEKVLAVLKRKHLWRLTCRSAQTGMLEMKRLKGKWSQRSSGALQMFWVHLESKPVWLSWSAALRSVDEPSLLELIIIRRKRTGEIILFEKCSPLSWVIRPVRNIAQFSFTNSSWKKTSWCLHGAPQKGLLGRSCTHHMLKVSVSKYNCSKQKTGFRNKVCTEIILFQF